MLVDGLRERRHEIHPLVFCPSRRAAIATHRGVVLESEMAVSHGVPPDALFQVDSQQPIRHVGTEGVTMKSHPLCGGQFHEHVGLVQFDGVIAWPHGLVVMRERNFLLVDMADGEERHVAQFADSRATQVCMAEPHQNGVGNMIARAPVPPTCVLCRSQLNKAEWHIGAKEHVSMSSRSYPGVDILGVGGGSCRRFLHAPYQE